MATARSNTTSIKFNGESTNEINTGIMTLRCEGDVEGEIVQSPTNPRHFYGKGTVERRTSASSYGCILKTIAVTFELNFEKPSNKMDDGTYEVPVNIAAKTQQALMFMGYEISLPNQEYTLIQSRDKQTLSIDTKTSFGGVIPTRITGHITFDQPISFNFFQQPNINLNQATQDELSLEKPSLEEQDSPKLD